MIRQIYDRWLDDAAKIKYAHALKCKRERDRIKNDTKPHRRRRAWNVKKHHRKQCRKDLKTHRKLYVRKLRGAYGFAPNHVGDEGCQSGERLWNDM